MDNNDKTTNHGKILIIYNAYTMSYDVKLVLWITVHFRYTFC